MNGNTNSFRLEGTAINTTRLVLFTLDDQHYALHLEAVERIVRAAALTPLPKAPGVVLGILDIQGEVIPVINLRKRFRLAEREIRPSDQFIVARTRSMKVVLPVDAVESVVEEAELEPLAPAGVMAGMDYVAGVTRTAEGLVLIHDLDTFLSSEEEKALADALAEEQS